LASTSLFEPFGLVIPEAMSCGLPIVAFDCPFGPSEIITDGVDGLLVEKENVDALADSLVKVMTSSEIREAMGSAILKKAEQFKIESIAMQWQKLFENIVR
jgi:glycosyltransferase involved in cell wall biosynthesis